MKRHLFFGSILCVVALAVACEDETATTMPADYAGSCAALASRCHDVAGAIPLECHELGHEGDDAKCGPRRTECLALCPERDASLPFSRDASVADADAGPDPSCTSYCTCMAASCASIANYPFAEDGACEAACASFSASDRSCFARFCAEAAADAGAKAHACDHASGKLGTIECE